MKSRKRNHSRIPAAVLAVLVAAMSVLPGSPVCVSSFADADSSTNIGNGNALYEPLKITGVCMPEEQLFTSEELLRVMKGLPDTVAAAPYEGDEAPQPEQGLDLLTFLKYCGADLEKADTRVLIHGNGGVDSNGLEMTEGIEMPASSLLSGDTRAVMRVPENNDQKRELLVLSNGVSRTMIADPILIIVGSAEDMSDPQYWLHDHDPFQYMKSIVFTVNFVDRAKYSDQDDNMQPFRTVRLTLGEIEKLMQENPDQVSGNYFGMSGNEATKNTMGLGGFFDYYEGLKLNWFLTEICGLKKGEGSAVFYGRDCDRYGLVKSLGYFFPESYEDYYLEMTKDYSINNVEPVLAVSKNGCPLLPVHDHDMAGSYEYNTFNTNAIAAGFSSKIGIQHNVSGPIIAALANLDGVYGGYQNETSGDCVRIDLYVDKNLYSKDSDKDLSFEDVPDSAWYADTVKTLVRRGVVNGMTKTTFAPNESVTRAQFVKMLACESDEALGYLPDMPFSDVSENSWCWPYIKWAYDHKIVNGTSEDTFSPNALISRQDMAVIIDRYLKYKEMWLPATTLNVKEFTDKGDIAGYASEAVQYLTGYLLNGYPDGTFRPRNGATRAEAAKVLCRCLDLQ